MVTRKEAQKQQHWYAVMVAYTPRGNRRQRALHLLNPGSLGEARGQATAFSPQATTIKWRWAMQKEAIPVQYEYSVLLSHIVYLRERVAGGN